MNAVMWERSLTWWTLRSEAISHRALVSLFVAVYVVLIGALHLLVSFPVCLALAFAVKFIDPHLPVWRTAAIWSLAYSLSGLTIYGQSKWRAIRAKRRAQITA